MKDVDSVEVDLPAGELGVGAGVVPECPVTTGQLQHDRVRSGSACHRRDALHVDSLLGEQAKDDFAQRIIAHRRTNAGRHPGRSERHSGIRDAAAEGELCRTNFVQLARLQFGNTGELGSDVDAKMPGDEY